MLVPSISFSSDKKLARCEQQHYYRYTEKLKRKVKSEGLFRGDVMHQMIESFRRDQDWEKTFRMWKKKVWGSLFDEQKEDYGLDFCDVIYDLMGHWVDHWSGEHKKWKYLYIEQDFQIMTKLGIPIRWKADAIAQEGKFTLLLENKNKKRIPTSEERILQGQTHGYCFLFEQKKIHIDTIIWDYIRTEPVPRPEMTKKGEVSKRKINTDQRQYLAFLKENKITTKSMEDALGIQNVLKSLPETLALERIRNRPNLKIGEQFVKDWVERARRAKGIARPLRNWCPDCRFDCDYYNLCQVDILGKTDRNLVIRRDFVSSKELEAAN